MSDNPGERWCGRCEHWRNANCATVCHATLVPTIEQAPVFATAGIVESESGEPASIDFGCPGSYIPVRAGRRAHAILAETATRVQELAENA